MNPEWIREFVRLVKAGAPIKAYQKKLGLNKEGLQYHLGRLAEYEASLEVKKAEVKRVKPTEKKVAKIVSLIKDAVKSKEQPKDETKKDDKDNAS
jgi:hypothetical protein